jgi:hypothetical protein
MKDLLKEAIADAKAVKQTALANAKLALEEAFTPRLQSMLSAKLAEELSEEEEEVEDTYTEDENYEDDTTPEAAVEEGEEETTPEDVPVQDELETEGEEGEDDDLDLEEIIRELEGDDSEEEVTESDDWNDYDDNGAISDDEGVTEGEEGEDEDIDINEIIRSLREEDEEEEMTEGEEEDSEELEEAYNVIRFLKGKINEVNLLNAKLLYSNKLFRNFALNEGQKMKVIENFDRAHNLREVKLVFSTLAEGFKSPSIKKSIKESYASKPVASTKPAKRILSEGADLASRFQKLAGLKK